MADVSVQIGADLAGFQADLHIAERQAAQASRGIASSAQRDLTRAAREYDALARAGLVSAKNLDAVSESAEDAAKSANSPEVKQAVRNWDELVRTIGSVAIAYIASRNAAAKAAREQESASKRLIQIGARVVASYVSIRQAISGVFNVVEVGAQFESLRGQLNGLFQSATRGRIAFQFIQDARVQAQGFSDALALLQGFGVSNVFATLEKLNAATLTLGDSQGRLGRIALAVGQAFAANALRLEEVNQLIDAGVPVYTIFQEKLGLSAKQVRELGSAGKLARPEIEALIDGIGEIGQGAEQRTLNSFNGALRQAKTEARGFINAIAEAGTLDFFQSQIRRLLAEVERLRATGQLQQIAQNISDSITAVSRGVVAIIERILAGLVRLASSEALPRFAAIAETALNGVARVTGLVVDNFLQIYQTARRVFIAFQIAKITVFTAAWAALVVSIIRYRTAIIAATVATTRFFAALAVGALGFARFTGLLAAAIAALVRYLATLSVVGGVLIAAGAAILYFVNRSADQKRALEEQRRELERNTAITREFADALNELGSAGLENIAGRIAELDRLRQQQGLPGEIALQAQRTLTREALALLDQRQRAEQNLAAAQERIAEHNKQALLEADKELLQQTIRTNEQELRDTEQKLKAIERSEKTTAKTIEGIRRELANVTRDTLDEVNAIRRRNLSEAQQQAAIEREAQNAIARATLAALEARTAQSEEAKKAALEQAEAQRQRATSLAKEVQDSRAAERLAFSVGQARKTILDEQLRLQEQVQARQADEKQSLEQQAEAIKATIADLKTELDDLSRKEPKVEIQVLIQGAEDARQQIDDINQQLQALSAANVFGKIIDAAREGAKFQIGLEGEDAVENDLEGIQRQIDELKKGATIPIRTTGGGAPGFARGGPVPGYGHRDIIPAMLTPGEYIINSYATRLYRPLLDQINALRLPRMPAMLSAESVQRYAAGGVVSGPDMGTLRIQIGAAPSREIRGSRETLRGLIQDLSAVARAT